jgi:hypothetical protein
MKVEINKGAAERVWLPEPETRSQKAEAGNRQAAVMPHEYPEAVRGPEAGPAASPQQMAAKGFGQVFGLHPAMAFLTVGVDLMLQSADIVSGGLLVPFSIAGGVVLAGITYCAQRKWYADDKESAGIKAAIVGLLTAIPTPLPYALFIPSGAIGWWHRRRERKGK